MNPIAVIGMGNQRWGATQGKFGRGVLPRPNPADPVKQQKLFICFPC